MKMGTAQKQNIAVQHRIWNKHRRPQPMSFKEWLLKGIAYYQAEGFTFELLTPSLMRIKRPGQNSLLRTCANFREEYEKEYLSKF
jgi:hypothetical protein